MHKKHSGSYQWDHKRNEDTLDKLKIIRRIDIFKSIEGNEKNMN